MADVKLNTLPQSTSPTSTQDLLLFDESTNAGQRINYNTLADVILAKLTSKTYTVGGGTQTLISAIDALNSKIKYVSKTITVPAGSQSSPSTVDIDFSEDVVSGTIYGLFASAGATPMPYVNNNGQVQTWIRSVGSKTVRIHETGTGYSSREWYFVLFIK